MSDASVWLVDASIYVFRPWFIRHLQEVDKQGNPVHAVLGFLRFVYNLLNSEKPEEIAFAFDTSLHTSVRREIYTAYKANRAAAPVELKYQFQLCREFLQAIGIVEAASHHYEADDLLGTWVTQAQQQSKACKIITGDKDLAQLVGEQDVWWDYGKRAALTIGGVKKTFGVWPQQIPDQLAIAGDAADNIPGVPGIGMATAAKLLQKFNSVESLLSRIPEIGLMKTNGAKRLQGLIEQYQDQIKLARQLTGIECAVPDLTQDLKRQPKDLAKLKELCELLGLSEQQYILWAEV
jgi:5'-3' exonuclease